MKKSIVLVVLILVSFSNFAQKKKDLIKEVANLKAKTSEMKLELAEIEKAKQLNLNDSLQNFSYAYGVSIGNNLKTVGIDSIARNAFALGLEDAIQGKEKLEIEAARRLTENTIRKIEEAENTKRNEKNIAFLAKNGKRPEVITTESGLQYEVLKKGDGAIPVAADKIKVHYTGMLIDGEVFDSSVERGEPAVFGVTQVIKGWQEALQLMPVGSKWMVFIPQELAYGERAVGGGLIPAYSALMFEMELLSIEK
jgi:FKBP-type peptidyl-prolyl cis-trans isomerase FklB